MLAHRYLRLWRAGNGPLALGLLLAALAPLIAGLGLWAASAPSNGCSADQREAVEEWREAGSVGEPPYDCDTY